MTGHPEKQPSEPSSLTVDEARARLRKCMPEIMSPDRYRFDLLLSDEYTEALAAFEEAVRADEREKVLSARIRITAVEPRDYIGSVSIEFEELETGHDE